VSLCEKCSRNESKAMRALESLTAGGSEFVDDVERCRHRIRETQSVQWQHILKLTKENKELRARMAQVGLHLLDGTEQGI
jgi:hypothetical protein